MKFCYLVCKMFKNVSPDLVRTCPANSGVRSWLVRKLIRPVRLSPNPYKNFVGFFVDLVTPKKHFEINWPLGMSRNIPDSRPKSYLIRLAQVFLQWLIKLINPVKTEKLSILKDYNFLDLIAYCLESIWFHIF